MKVIAFNGSPRKKGNTFTLLSCVLDTLETEGIETELVKIGGKNIRGCIACYKCFDNKDKRCSVDSDILNDCVAKMLDADGILLGSPTYFANMSPELKCLIDRSGLVAKANGEMFRRKVGAAVVAVRRAGAVHTFDAINHFFTIGQMIVPGSSYWNLGIGRDPGEASGDEEGMQTMVNLGKNMAWLMKKLNA
jgi:multimeric flavodoxin WrbA